MNDVSSLSPSTVPDANAAASASLHAHLFPSVAEARTATREQIAAANKLGALQQRPTKMQAYFTLMMPDQVKALAASYMLSADLIPQICVHFLHHSRTFSPECQQHVVAEPQLSSLLVAQIKNARLVNRLYHLFARADPFGMQVHIITLPPPPPPPPPLRVVSWVAIVSVVLII
jgi:hypothetical protein